MGVGMRPTTFGECRVGEVGERCTLSSISKSSE